MSSRNETAWQLYERGLTVLPAHPTQKRPLVSWERYQVEDVPEDTMLSWMTSARYRGCNWALITGKEFVVVDADSEDAITWVTAHLPWTSLRVRTSRGKHFYYRSNPACRVKTHANPQSKLDVRGDGGIVIAPGSVHESGAVYTIEADTGIDDPWYDIPIWQPEFMARIEAENAPPASNVLEFKTPDTDGGWHDRMIREVASKVMLGFTDEEILAEAPGWTEAGYTHAQTVREFQEALAGARRKFGAEAESKRVLDEARQQERQQEREQEAEDERAALAPTPFVLPDDASIRPREWVYGRHYIRRFLSVTIAGGGSGKTSVVVAESIAMASQRPILGVEVEAPRRVWLWNLEDPMDEMQRRIAAICRHYNVSAAELGDRLYVNSGRDNNLLIAQPGPRGEAALTNAVEALLSHIKKHQIDVIIVDPFVSSHRLNENDNGAMDLVVKAWGRIAHEGNCAVELVHHTRKIAPNQDQTTGDARGASALTDAARHVRRLQRMSAEEAKLAGIDEAEFWRFSRDGDSKDNLAPPGRASSWRQMVSVDLANGDNVGVIAPWAWPNAFEDVTVEDMDRVLTEVQRGTYREDARSKDWAGHAIAKVLELDVDEPSVRADIKTMLKTWIKNRQLKIVERADDHRKTRRFVELGDAPQWTRDLNA